MTEWGVRFNDGSVRHPWNGRTARRRAWDELHRLLSDYPGDRFVVVSRDSREAAWVEHCPWSGLMIESCKRRDLCDCFAFPEYDDRA